MFDIKTVRIHVLPIDPAGKYLLGMKIPKSPSIPISVQIINTAVINKIHKEKKTKDERNNGQIRTREDYIGWSDTQGPDARHEADQ